MNLKPKQALQKYLMLSYLYYVRMESVVEDAEYDALAKFLLSRYNDWQDHQHAYLVSKEDLESGTLYAVSQKDYPKMIVASADVWLRDMET